jgi:hypothetical protein|tara:strand:+ start:3708 stop:4004 length:297 start_codon:yes stop_codon:yes gene_type:complete
MIYVLSLTTIVSLAANALLIWYIHEYIKRVRQIQRTTIKFRKITDNYKEALEKLTRMEIYYGEPTIQTLMESTYFVIDQQDKLSSSLLQILGEEKNNE